jgi:lysostaphin
MPARLRLFFVALLPFFAFGLACDGGLDLPVTPTPQTTSQPDAQFPTAVSANTGDAVATLPAATTPATQPMERPTSTAVPATSTPEPQEPVVFKPAKLAQGAVTIVYFNEPANSATLSFGGKQYPMLKDGNRWWAIIGVGAFATPGLAPVTIAYVPSPNAATQSVTQSIEITDRDFPVVEIELDSQTASLLAPDIIQNELNKRASIYSGYTTQRMWSGAFVRPADGDFSSIYGEGRSYNGSPVTDYHRGTDFVGGIGDNVYAAAAGRVVFVQQLQVRGNSIVIDHGAGVFTAYHHLSEFDVKEGDMVTPGQLIGKIGSTGLVTGPHLHWEVIVRGIEVDGRLWLNGAEVGP